MTPAVHCVCSLTCNNTQSGCMSSHHPFSLTTPASPSAPLLLLPLLPLTLDPLAATGNPLATGGMVGEEGEEGSSTTEAEAATGPADADSACSGSGGAIAVSAAVAVAADVAPAAAMAGVLLGRAFGRGEKMRGESPEMML